MTCLSLGASSIAFGSTLGRWTVGKSCMVNGRTAYSCTCSCGAERVVLRQSLVSGVSTSCGCFCREQSRKRFLTHGSHKGGKKTPTYQSWDAMLSRVRHQHSRETFKPWIGCTVDQRWDPQQGGSFQNFLKDMGERPEGTSLDKDSLIFGNRHYGPGRCVWANRATQAKFKTQAVWIEYQGRKQNLREWLDEIGISFPGLRNRITRGWSIEKALTTPVQKRTKPAPSQDG